MVAIFWIGRKPRCEVSMASASQTVRTALDLSGPGASDLATASHHSRRQLLANAAIIIARIEAVRTRRDPKTGSRYGVLNLLHNFPLQTDHTLGPFSGGLPKTLDIGEAFSAYFPYTTGKTFLADDLRLIGFLDTFNRHHWAPRRDMKNVLAKYRKEIGAVAPTNQTLERE